MLGLTQRTVSGVAQVVRESRRVWPPVSEFTDRMRGRRDALAKRGEEWFVKARERGLLVDFAADLFDRDKEANASVLGSTIALRLFLFLLPATVTLVGLAGVLTLTPSVEDDIDASVITGVISKSLFGISWLSSLWFFVTGLFLTLMAGRSLAKVLAACAGGAWGLTVHESRVKPVAVAALSGVLLADFAASIVFTRLRESGGLPVAVVAWTAVLATTTVTWFLVMLTLPRKVNDPGALLPGAAMMGVGYTVLQWFMQFYLPNRIARTTDTFGEIAVTVATLGNFFFIGRLMASSFVVGAVVYERWGSLSQLVFALPGLRRAAARSPQLRTFFSLDEVQAEASVDPPAEPPDPL